MNPQQIITLPIDECHEAARLVVFTAGDERSRYGQVRLLSDGKQRAWCATDSYHAGLVPGGADAEVYDVAIPPALLRFAELAEDGSGEVTLLIDKSAELITISGPGGSMTVTERPIEYPDITHLFNQDHEILGSVTLRSHRLYDVLDRKPRVVALETEDSQIESPPHWLVIDADGLAVDVDWHEMGRTRLRVPTENMAGGAAAPIGAELLRLTLTLFRPDEPIEIRVPKYNRDPFIVVGERRRAFVMPIRTPEAKLREKVERIINEVAGPVALNRDADGDYPLYLTDSAIYGRLLVDADPPVLQVFAVVVRGVEKEADLLAEVNDLNAELQFARLFIVEEQILAEVDLVAATLDSEELRNAIDKLRDVDRRIKPMLATVFGGDPGVDPFDARWHASRTAVIEAEIAPGFLSPLNGPDGLSVWPFPGNVFAITGWNPQGITINAEANDVINRRIAHDLIDAGGRFLHGTGHNPDDTHTEQTLIAWDITREQALRFGRKASQDAIYQLSADEVRLLSCSNAREESWPRIPIEPRKTAP